MNIQNNYKLSAYFIFHFNDNLNVEIYMRRFSAFMFGILASKLHGPGIDKNTQASGEIPRLYVRPTVP